MYIPIIPYLNLSARLTLSLTSFIMIAGSFTVRRRWSKNLMSYRGIAFPAIFLLTLFLGTRAASIYINTELALIGNFTINLLTPFSSGHITVSTPSTASLTGTFWLAVAAGLISLAGKIVQNKASPTR
ncbi:MAG: hypothetical protein QXI19_11715 [Candidatus Caldarchaeum sp.]